MGKRRTIIDAMFKLRLFDAVSPRAQLTVLTYHRIGEVRAGFEYDRTVFGPTEESFARQMQWLATHADPVCETDVIAAADGRVRLPRRSVLVTFDDAYNDQFTVALPILKASRVPATFFVTPGMIDEQTVGFWDHIAHAVRYTGKSTLSVDNRLFNLADKKSATTEITRWVKEQPASETFRLTAKIRDMLEVAPPPRDRQASELMNWDEIAAIAHDEGGHGFSIGSHGMTHRLLARLDRADQEVELRESKRRLEEQLGVPIRSLAYPAGSFGPETPQIARHLGYQAVFSFESGFNEHASLQGYDIKRIPAGDTPSLVACATSMPWALGASYYP
jgi:peptidoglycan/xylan/chitin deacetylase (PgdA/CDA1 family)